MHPGYTDFCERWASGNTSLIFDVTRCRLPLPSACTNAFDDDYIRIFNGNYVPTCWMTFRPITLFSISWDPIQVHRSKPCVTFCRQLSLLYTQLYYFLRLSVFVNEPFRSKAQKLLAQVLRKRQLQSPTTLTQLLLPPLHVRNWKALLGTWLQSWIASHRDLFPSLFLPKIQVVETRSATLGDRIYNYRTWQRRWTPETSFPCRCLDIDDHHIHRAHGHAVMVDEFSSINADIDMEIMAASMKDQYFGDVDLLHQRFTTQLRKLARRWHVHGSSLLVDLQPVLTQLMDTH